MPQTLNAGPNIRFQRLFLQKAEKRGVLKTGQGTLAIILVVRWCFLNIQQNAGWDFIPRKTCFLWQKGVKYLSTSVISKKKYFLLFLPFWQEVIEKAYFDQCLECAAPKRWSKYTTLIS